MENRTPETIIARVVAALIAQPGNGLDLVTTIEYPGYIHIITDNQTHYATGTANDTWTLDRLSADHDTEHSIDTEIATTENDATVIADAIIAAIQEDQA